MFLAVPLGWVGWGCACIKKEPQRVFICIWVCFWEIVERPCNLNCPHFVILTRVELAKLYLTSKALKCWEDFFNLHQVSSWSRMFQAFRSHVVLAKLSERVKSFFISFENCFRFSKSLTIKRLFQFPKYFAFSCFETFAIIIKVNSLSLFFKSCISKISYSFMFLNVNWKKWKKVLTWKLKKRRKVGEKQWTLWRNP